jgi:hypothetical protein
LACVLGQSSQRHRKDLVIAHDGEVTTGYVDGFAWRDIVSQIRALRTVERGIRRDAKPHSSKRLMPGQPLAGGEQRPHLAENVAFDLSILDD